MVLTTDDTDGTDLRTAIRKQSGLRKTVAAVNTGVFGVRRLAAALSASLQKQP